MKITVNQLRRIIKEEVRRIVEASPPPVAPRGPAVKVNKEVRGFAREIAEIIGQGKSSDYLSVAQIVSGFINYEPPYYDEVSTEQVEDPLELISDELGKVISDSDGKLDFDGLAAAETICDEFSL